MKTKTKLKRESTKRLKTKTKKIENENAKNSKTCQATKVLAYNMVLTGATAVRH